MAGEVSCPARTAQADRRIPIHPVRRREAVHISMPMSEDGGPAHLMSLTGLAGMLEFVGGALLLIGLFTRPVAFILSGEMAFAYFIGHASQSFWPVVNQGVTAILFCF